MAKHKLKTPVAQVIRRIKRTSKGTFQKGVSGNPEGGRAHNPIKKALFKLTIEKYREIIELILTGNLEAIKQAIENPETPAIQVAIGTAFVRACSRGDYEVVERIAERIVGKIPDQININSQNANLNATVSLEEVKSILKKLEEDV